jgi:hypothetical protein
VAEHATWSGLSCPGTGGDRLITEVVAAATAADRVERVRAVGITAADMALSIAAALDQKGLRVGWAVGVDAALAARDTG